MSQDSTGVRDERFLALCERCDFECCIWGGEAHSLIGNMSRLSEDGNGGDYGVISAEEVNDCVFVSGNLKPGAPVAQNSQ